MRIYNKNNKIIIIKVIINIKIIKIKNNTKMNFKKLSNLLKLI